MPQREAIHSCELPEVSMQHVSAARPRAHVRTTDKGANRMIRFNVRALATAGLAAAMLASSAAAAAAADGPADEKGPPDAAVSAYQRAYPRISLEMAQRGAEQQDARKALYEQLIGKDGASFGGAWYDVPAGILHIATTDPALGRDAAGERDDVLAAPGRGPRERQPDPGRGARDEPGARLCHSA